MSIRLKETHEKILKKAKKKARLIHWILILLLVFSFSYHWVERVSIDLIKDSYLTVKYHLKERQSRYALLEVLRNKPLTIGQALEIADAVIDESRDCKVPIHMIFGIIDLESEFRPGAISSEGARGLMQIMPERWKEYVSSSREFQNLNLRHNPTLNVRVGIRYLGDLMQRYNGDWKKVLKAYGGYVRVSPDIYVRLVMAKAAQYKIQLEGKGYESQ
ncbi:MAG: lytic transglycosylase domain-containing protein [Desulfobacterales bacterium]|nr:lytic transglycosylase domain-containing protein [Desulfobacterales bacterium]